MQRRALFKSLPAGIGTRSCTSFCMFGSSFYRALVSRTANWRERINGLAAIELRNLQSE